MKKMVSLMLVLMLTLCALPAALAEEAVLLWEADSIYELKGLTDAVKVSKGRQSSVVTLSGEVIVAPAEYAYLQSTDLGIAPDCFVFATDGGLNNLMVIDREGNVITADLYGDVKPISANWLRCAVMSETTGADYDFKAFSGNKRYIADRYDLYYIPTRTCVAQLTRDQYSNAQERNGYLFLQDDAGVVRLYDASFQEVEVSIPFRAFTECSFKAVVNGDAYDVVSRITGQTIATGYSSYVSNCSEDLLAVRANNYTGLMDHQGNLVLPTEYDIINFNRDTGLYKLRRDSLVGVYDPAAGALIPCEYSDLLGKTVVGDTTYYCMVADGKVGYVNQNGEVTCAFGYDRNAVKVLGCSMFIKDEAGAITLISADGQATTLAGVTDTRSLPDASQGRYVCVQNADGQWGIVNWHGEVVFDFCSKYSSSFKFIDATHFIFNSKYMYELQ